MTILKSLKQEAVKSDDLPAGAPGMDDMSNEPPTSGGDSPVDDDIDSDEAAMYGSVDDDLFGVKEDSDDDFPPDDEQDELPREEAPPPPADTSEVITEAPTQVETPAEVPPQQQVVVPEQPVVAEPETPAPDRAAMRSMAEAELQKRYALSKEDADAMISEPETVLPRIASQLYLDIFDDVMQNVQNILPQAVQHINRTANAAQKDESDFYSSWPALKSHSQEVMRIGQMYRQLNPTATKEQFIQDVGLQSMIQLKLPIQGQQQSSQPTPQPAPYSPPRGGSVNTPPGAPASNNPFAGLAEEWSNDEW